MEIDFKSEIFSVAFHSDKDLLAGGTIDGTLKYGPIQHLSSSLKLSGSVRSLEFTQNALLYSSRNTWGLIDIESNSKVISCKGHSAPINVIKNLDSNLVATGDDNGIVKIWDLRSRKLAHKYQEHSDYISDMAFVPERNVLGITGGDGLLSIIDDRKSVIVSENQDDELLSIVFVRVFLLDSE
jgi:WD40 repeat protein